MTSLLALLLACAGSQKPDPEALPEPIPTELETPAEPASPVGATPQLSRAAPRPKRESLPKAITRTSLSLLRTIVTRFRS